MFHFMFVHYTEATRFPEAQYFCMFSVVYKSADLNLPVSVLSIYFLHSIHLCHWAAVCI